MSRKRKTYTADLKAKLVLEVLEGTKTLNKIATQYELYSTPISQTTFSNI